jgi:O-antigen polymerase
MTIPLFYRHSAIELSIYRIIGLWGGLALFITIQQFRLSNSHKQRLIWFIVLACLIEACIAYVQLLLGTDKTHLPSGAFPTSDAFITFLSTGILASGYLLSRHLKKYQKQISITALLYFTPLICAPLLVGLGSMVYWGISCIGLLVIFPYLYRFASRKRLIGWSISAVLGILAGLILAYQLNSGPFSLSRHTGFEPLSNSIIQTLDMLIERPFTGYGYGRFESEYVLYSARQHQLNPSYPPAIPGFTHPQNELLYWGIEGGLLPILAMVLAVLFVLIRIYSAKQRTRLATLALLFPIVLHSQIAGIFYLSAIHWVTLVILLFWTDQRVAKYKDIHLHRATAHALRIIMCIIPVAACIYLGNILRTQYLLTRAEKEDSTTASFNDIDFPLFWEDRLMMDKLTLLLQKNTAPSNHQPYKTYTNWLLKLIQREPRPVYYQQLITLYQRMGDTNKAKQTRIEAEFLFPNMSFKGELPSQ